MGVDCGAADADGAGSPELGGASTPLTTGAEASTRATGLRSDDGGGEVGVVLPQPASRNATANVIGASFMSGGSPRDGRISSGMSAELPKSFKAFTARLPRFTEVWRWVRALGSIFAMVAFDTRERPKAGHRTREWTAVAASELEVVREMARCLELISEGRWPE